MDFPHGETVVVFTAGTTADPYSGATTADWSTATTLEVPCCGVADGGSVEPVQDARDQVASDFDVIMPPGTVVTAQNRLLVRGLLCEVVGRPFDWRNPFTGWNPAVFVRAKISEG